MDFSLKQQFESDLTRSFVMGKRAENLVFTVEESFLRLALLFRIAINTIFLQ